MYSLIFAPPAHAITFVERGEVCFASPTSENSDWFTAGCVHGVALTFRST
jgi:hypothetical protein